MCEEVRARTCPNCGTGTGSISWAADVTGTRLYNIDEDGDTTDIYEEEVDCETGDGRFTCHSCGDTWESQDDMGWEDPPENCDCGECSYEQEDELRTYGPPICNGYAVIRRHEGESLNRCRASLANLADDPELPLELPRLYERRSVRFVLIPEDRVDELVAYADDLSNHHGIDNLFAWHREPDDELVQSLVDAQPQPDWSQDELPV